MSALPVLQCAPPAAANAADALLAAAAAVQGWGLVDFVDEAGAANAINKFNDQELMGRKIFLREDRDTGAGAGGTRHAGIAGGGSERTSKRGAATCVAATIASSSVISALTVAKPAANKAEVTNECTVYCFILNSIPG